MRTRHWVWLVITALAALAHADQPSFSTGLRLADPARYQSVPLASAPLMGDLPRTVDMTADFPRPGDQGKQGSCVGWAVAYGLKSYHGRKRTGWRLMESSHLFSPAYVFNQVTQSRTCQGALYADALNVITSEGAATWAEFPYSPASCDQQPDAALRASAHAWRAEFWRRVNQADVTEIKAQLAAGFPVLIGMMVDEAFQRLRGSVVYSATGGAVLGSHAMVVIGYDDDRSAFKVLNSWGQLWGDGGYGWIAYQLLPAVVREAYVVKDVDTPAPTPTPNPAPGPGPQPTPPPYAMPSLVPPILAEPQAQVMRFNGTSSLVIKVTGTIKNARGHTVQVVVRFGMNTPTGQQGLPANPGSPFRDFAGFMATGTNRLPIIADSADLALLTIALPLTEFRIGGPVVMRALIFLDEFQIGQSNPGSAFVPVPVPSLGGFCCDGFGNRRCMINTSPVGSGCFCRGQGRGITCP